MNSSAKSASILLNNIGWSQPNDMTIEEIAWACGLIVKFQQMDGSQGRIVMSNNDAIITVNDAITYQPKINYILSHEIGHACLHRSLNFFSDNDKTLNEWYAKGTHEKEANLFAEELLLPTDLFIKKIKNKKLSLPLIEETAEYFHASKTATFLRYRDLGEFPLMIVFIENGIIKWKSPSTDFPYKWLTLGNKLPVYTVAGDYFYHQREEKHPVKVDAIEWFQEDFICQKSLGAKLWEQCFPSTENSILTCLWSA